MRNLERVFTNTHIQTYTGTCEKKGGCVSGFRRLLFFVIYDDLSSIISCLRKQARVWNYMKNLIYLYIKYSYFVYFAFISDRYTADSPLFIFNIWQCNFSCQIWLILDIKRKTAALPLFPFLFVLLPPKFERLIKVDRRNLTK